MSRQRYKKTIPLLVYCAAMVAIFVAMAAYCGLFLAPWQHKIGVWQPSAAVSPLGVVLEGPQFSLRRDKTVLWQSEPAWRVQDFVVGDINHDDVEELLLLVWRRGNYGPSRPFWVTGSNTDRYTQHLFIYAWDEEKGNVAPLWMSSRLAPEIKHFSMTGDGDLRILTPAGEDTLWGWRSWGIVRLDAPLYQ